MERVEQGEKGVAAAVVDGARRELRADPAASASRQVGAESVRPRRRWRGLILGGVAVLALGLLAVRGGPMVVSYFGHVSTDDAFVTGDATTVGSRITDVVEQVLVHDNDYVAKGDLVVRLDREPYRIKVEQGRRRAASDRIDD